MERWSARLWTLLTVLATAHDPDIVVRGEKFFSTNADFADFLIVLAGSSTAAGHLAVVIARNTPGVRIVRRWELVGLRSSGRTGSPSMIAVYRETTCWPVRDCASSRSGSTRAGS